MKPGSTAGWVAAWAAVGLLGLGLCQFPRFKQFCGETAVYRIGLGLHACESNDEAADDFSCNADVGGWREALLPRNLTAQECARTRSHLFVPWVLRVVVDAPDHSHGVVVPRIAATHDSRK